MHIPSDLGIIQEESANKGSIRDYDPHKYAKLGPDDESIRVCDYMLDNCQKLGGLLGDRADIGGS